MFSPFHKMLRFGLVACTVAGLTLPALAQDLVPPKKPVQNELSATLDSLTDIPDKHWARPAIKLLMEDLGAMKPKYPRQFAGNEEISRYELAMIFYRLFNKLEEMSGHDLGALTDFPETDIVDVDRPRAEAVDAVVNDIGIMMIMPRQKFRGEEHLARYNLALQLHHYFKLLEKAGIEPTSEPRDHFKRLSDIPMDHWARDAVKACVDKYKVFNASPNGKFNGSQRLNRYATAAVIREVVRYLVTDVIPQLPLKES